MLLGLQRVKLLDELKSDCLYREARVEICEDYYAPHRTAQFDQLQAQLREGSLKILPVLPEAQGGCDT